MALTGGTEWSQRGSLPNPQAYAPVTLSAAFASLCDAVPGSSRATSAAPAAASVKTSFAESTNATRALAQD